MVDLTVRSSDLSARQVCHSEGPEEAGEMDW